ncbi:MAG: tRNA (N6-isopentenyl adenosine(37)-C2)-methylthiotransferase MiaB [Ruminococcaceae bacterium]|nr:tRNA (N6-isopentenyl adenosine(37)-C2)-methylthiotransferase MiaB [Oscillospiraceae bacterium]
MNVKKNNILPPSEMEKQFEYIEKIKEDNLRYAEQNGARRRAFVMTFGCQQNEADSEKIAGMAEAMGYDICEEPSAASLIVVNTCAIREHAEQKALSVIGQYKHLKNKDPELIIAVCGCMVTQEHRVNEIKFSYPYVDFVFGTSSIHRLPELIFEKKRLSKRLYCPEEAEYLVAEGIPMKRKAGARAWVSVMYGCNNFCSYCIVPYVRGRERSRTREAVYAEVKELIEKGYKDITLLGQNVNSYGKDSGYDYDFADLIAYLDTIEGDYMLHFMTSHPKDATKKLVDTMAEGKHIAHHFHLPMQSGSNSVLKEMNRRYTFDAYMEKVDYIREKMPDAVITSDIMVGFPGESEEDFEDTLKALRRARFDMIYSFIYSPRKGTPAAELEEQIPENVKSARFERLLATQNAISLEMNKPLEGKTIRVLCDGRSKNNSSVFSGRTEGNKIVFFDGEDTDTGKFLNVTIERADTFALYGKIVK